MNLQVQTAIEGSFEQGIKSFQSLTFNMWGQIVSHWASVGSTSFGLFSAHGYGSFSASVWSAGGRYLANMTGSAQTIVGLPPIDYSFIFSGSFGGGAPTLTGAQTVSLPTQFGLTASSFTTGTKQDGRVHCENQWKSTLDTKLCCGFYLFGFRLC